MPIDASSPERLDAFDPLAVPTVTQLLGEIDAWDRRAEGPAGPEGPEGSEGTGGAGEVDGRRNAEDDGLSDEERRMMNGGKANANANGNTNGNGNGIRKMADYEKTSLKPYVDCFRAFVAGLLRDERGGGKRERGSEPDGHNHKAGRNGAVGVGVADPMEF